MINTLDGDVANHAWRSLFFVVALKRGLHIPVHCIAKFMWKTETEIELTYNWSRQNLLGKKKNMYFQVFLLVWEALFLVNTRIQKADQNNARLYTGGRKEEGKTDSS